MVINYETSYSYTVCEKRLFLREHHGPNSRKSLMSFSFHCLILHPLAVCMPSRFLGFEVLLRMRASSWLVNPGDLIETTASKRNRASELSVMLQPSKYTVLGCVINLKHVLETVFGKNRHCFMGTFSIQTVVIAVNF